LTASAHGSQTKAPVPGRIFATAACEGCEAVEVHREHLAHLSKDDAKEIARGLQVLQARIEAARIPPSILDESINIATWNIRAFGAGRRKTASIHYIAEILNQFDLIAITELRDSLHDLERVLRILGPYWRVVYSDYNTDSAGNHERIGYLYDKRAVVFTGLAAEADPLREKSPTGEYLPTLTWWRPPFMASFRAGHFDFVALTAHIRYGDRISDRVAPLEALAEWVDKRQNEKNMSDRDIVVMGDFNIPSKGSSTYKAITSRGLRMPEGLCGTDLGSNLEKDKRYDQILHNPRYTKCFTNIGGVLDFYGGDHEVLLPGLTKDQFKNQLSDHLVLWMQLRTDHEEEELEQILNR
jgi:endonuclease/exonuclease/phosphatase family metal-dependent hydrolase